MSFIYPSFLWALLLIAVPIIIHLVNLRRHQTVYFSNVSLLKRVKKETQRKSKLKQLLILTCRILLISFLVFAFAKPYLPTGTTEKQMANNVVGIYIDNSFSMNAEGTEGRAIESARQKAYAIVNGSRNDTRFLLLNNTLDELQNRFYSKSEAIRLISDVDVNHNWTEMSTIQRRFMSITEKFLLETNKSFYLISDFQKHTTDFANFETDSVSTYNFIPVPINKVSNLYVDTCWFDAPTHHYQQIELLNVRIVNSSSEDYFQIPVNFYLNDTLKALASIDITAGEEKIVTLQYTNLSTGLQLGYVEITDYPIVYDNNIFLAYEVKESLNALLIQQRENRTTRNINALFSGDSYIHLDIERADRLQISSLENYSTIFLNELRTISSGLTDELVKFAQNGGTLVIIPDQNLDTESYNNLLSLLNSPTISHPDTIEIPIGDVAYKHQLFTDVFRDESEKVSLPDIKYRYRFSNIQQIAETNILTFSDQSKALSGANTLDGKLYVFAFPFSPVENEFLNHLLFLPTVYNMVLQSAHNQQLYNTIGKERAFDLKLTDRSRSRNIVMKHQQTGKELIPSVIQQRGNTLRLSVNGDFEAGFYLIYSEGIPETGLAFNYQLKESDFDYYKGDEILKNARQAGLVNTNLIEANHQKLMAAIEEIDQGKQLWKLFILLGLLFLLAEAAIIRFWK